MSQRRRSWQLWFTLLGGVALLPLAGRDLPGQLVLAAGASAETCVGDCDADGAVAVDELIVGINIALGLIPLDRCTSLDSDGSATVTIDELLLAVQAALEGCSTAAATSRIEIAAPRNGDFTTEGSVTVAGRVVNPPTAALITVNGVTTGLLSNDTFSAGVSLHPDLIFHPLVAELTDPETSFNDRDRVVVVAGDSVADGEEVEQGVALRLTDAGLGKLAVALPALLDIDADSLIAPGTVVVNNYCVLDSPFGCLQRVDVTVKSTTVESISVDLDAMEGFLAADVVLDDLVVALDIRGGVVDCAGRASVEHVRIVGNYELQPQVSGADSIDVNLIGDPLIEVTGDDIRFTGGACDDNPIDRLIRVVAGDFRTRFREALLEFLMDPDGDGPLDAPVAAAMQSGLSDLDFTEPLGESFGISFETSYFGIDEDAAGVTFGSDSLATAPPPAQSLFPASYRVDETFPILTSMTPTANHAYDLGLCVSTTALNQMIKAIMERGGLSLDLTELDFGSGPIPITAATLSLIIPEAHVLDPDLPITLRFRPTVPPVLTGAPGRAGELADLQIAGLLVEVVSGLPGPAVTHVRAALDARAAFDLMFDATGRELQVGLTPPRREEILVTVLDDQLGVDEVRLQANLAGVITQFAGLLSRALGSFDLPTLFGLQARGVEISRAGEFPCMFLALEPMNAVREGAALQERSCCATWTTAKTANTP